MHRSFIFRRYASFSPNRHRKWIVKKRRICLFSRCKETLEVHYDGSQTWRWNTEIFKTASEPTGLHSWKKNSSSAVLQLSTIWARETQQRACELHIHQSTHTPANKTDVVTISFVRWRALTFFLLGLSINYQLIISQLIANGWVNRAEEKRRGQGVFRRALVKLYFWGWCLHDNVTGHLLCLPLVLHLLVGRLQWCWGPCRQDSYGLPRLSAGCLILWRTWS